MNDNRMKQWMESVDDDLLEEAQRPLPAAGGLHRWGALAACFCAAALALALWQPWNAAKSDCGAFDDANGSGAGDYAAMDKSFAAPTPSAGDAEPLSATLVLPADAELASDELQFTARSDAPAAAPSGTAVCTIVLGGYDYDYGAVYASAPLPAPDGALPETIWQLSDTLAVMLYGGGAVGWYDAAAGIQWYCVAWDGGAPLVTAFALMDAQSYTVPTAPSGAETQGYDLFDLDGMTVTEVTFTLDGRTWRYRMAPTMDILALFFPPDRFTCVSGILYFCYCSLFLLKKAACIKQTALQKFFFSVFLFYSGPLPVSIQFFACFRNTKQKPPEQFQRLHTCVRGFEPPTFWSVAKRSIQLS